MGLGVGAGEELVVVGHKREEVGGVARSAPLEGGAPVVGDVEEVQLLARRRSEV